MSIAGRWRCALSWLLVLLLPLNQAYADQVVKGSTGNFQLTVRTKGGDNGLPLWEVRAEGTYFVGGGWFLAECECAVPGGQNKERVSFLANGSEET